MLEEMSLGAGGMSAITQLSVMQKLSTGNMVVDLLLCMAFPLVLGYCEPIWVQLKEWLEAWLKPRNTMYVRSIEMVARSGVMLGNKYENRLLMEAILLYVGSQTQLVDSLMEANYVLHGESDDEGEDYSDCGEDGECRVDDEPKRPQYSVNTEPADDLRIDLGGGIFLTKTEEVTTHGGEKDTKRDIKKELRFECAAPDAAARIQSWIDLALKFYEDRERRRAEKDVSRYLYMPVSKRHNDEDATDEPVYKRYTLSEEKTFTTFFHDDKDALIGLVDHFLNRTGKFAIEGYPHKLGLLLHGPPGTGKTTLIKALAQYTRRSIIAVPLTKISTNQELMNCMVDQTIQVHGDSYKKTMPYSKIIFILEDVDAAGSAVHRRKGKDAVNLHPLSRMDSDMVTDCASSSGTPCAKHQTRSSATYSEPLSGADIQKQVQLAIASAMKPSGDASGSTDAKGPSDWFKKMTAESDELNLAGILNVLDGVVDCPGRMIIMTTNHPEQLDPALIRPGRVNKKIFLGYLTPKHAASMVQHYFPGVSEAALEKFKRSIPQAALTPAKLESLCVEHDTFDTLLQYLIACDGAIHSGIMPVIPGL